MGKETLTNETSIAVIQTNLANMGKSIDDINQKMDKLIDSFVTQGDFNVLKLDVSYVKKINIFLIGLVLTESVALIFAVLKLTIIK